MKFILFYLTILILVSIDRSYSQSWIHLGNGANDEITVMYSDSVSGKLFIGGNFTEMNSLPMNHVASWDGQNWDSLEGGLYGGGPVLCINRFQNNLFFGGNITEANENGTTKIINGLAVWDGNSWDSIQNGFHQYSVPTRIVEFNGELYFAGSFDSVGPFRSSFVVKYDGMNWIPMGIPHIDPNSIGVINDCVIYNNSLYIGGVFNDSTYAISNFASYNNSQWVNHCVPNGCGDIHALAVYNNEIYLSGIYFVGPGQHIMKFDGSNYSALSGDLDWRALKLKAINNVLIAAGDFNYAGGNPASKIAIWDGQNWSPFSNDIFDGAISDIEVYNDELYISGVFRQINGITYNGIAKYSIPISEIEKINFKKKNYYYPNPATTELKIKTELFEQTCFSIIINVFDLAGKNVLSYKNNILESKPELTLDVSHLTNGIYIIKIVNNQNIFEGKFIKLNQY